VNVVCLEGICFRAVVPVLCGTDAEGGGEGPPVGTGVAYTLLVLVLGAFAFLALLESVVILSPLVVCWGLPVCVCTL